MKILAASYDPLVQLSLVPSPLAQPCPISRAVDARAQEIRAVVDASGGVNQTRPVVRSLAVRGRADRRCVHLDVWRGDWAYTVAARRHAEAHPRDLDLRPALFGGPIRVAVVVLVGDLVLLSRRSARVGVNPGVIARSADEGVDWYEDVVPLPDGRMVLPVQAVAARAAAEELGLALPPHVFEPTIAVATGGAHGPDFGVRVRLDLGLEDVLAAHERAVDRDEGDLLAVPAEQALQLVRRGDVAQGTFELVAASLG